LCAFLAARAEKAAYTEKGKTNNKQMLSHNIIFMGTNIKERLEACQFYPCIFHRCSFMLTSTFQKTSASFQEFDLTFLKKTGRFFFFSLYHFKTIPVFPPIKNALYLQETEI